MPTLNAFSTRTNGRGESGALNDEREKAIELLLSRDASERKLLIGNPRDGAQWLKIKSKLENAVSLFVANGAHGVPKSIGKLVSVERRGGRSHNYDFDGHFVCENGDQIGLKLELKRGESIYDQPQFLQLYAKEGDMVALAFEPYSSWFYDNYIADVVALAGVVAPRKSDYLAGCFGTNYEVFAHTEVLYQLDVRGSTTNSKLQELAFKSIDEYLSELETSPEHVDMESIQRRLNDQLGKLFVSWDPARQDFVIEVFSKQSMTLTGEILFKKRRNGQRSSLVVMNAASQPINALLRWKNHNCLLGPAWQISLSAV